MAAVELFKDGLHLRFFTTLTTFGTPLDVTLQELAIECCFPADAETEHFFRQLAAHDSVTDPGLMEEMEASYPRSLAIASTPAV